VSVPDREIAADDDGGSGFSGNERAVGQAVPGGAFLDLAGSLAM